MLSTTILRSVAGRYAGRTVSRLAGQTTAATTMVVDRPPLRQPQPQPQQRFLATSKSVSDALVYSGYSEIDFTIPETATVYEAVQKFAAFNIGCLVTVDAAGNMTGVLSERDYICKIALLGRTSKETKCKEICTVAGKIVTAKSDESVELCMEKMMNHGIRHLPIVDETKKVIGMVSIKDLVKTVVQEKEQAIKVLSDFALGKGGHFGSE